MAAAAASNGTWLRPAVPSKPLDKSTITYSDRPIRPLPRRRIRSRLSDEQADNIIFPPVVSASSPPFESPPSQGERGFGNSQLSGDIPPFPIERNHDHFCDCGEPHSPGDSEDGDDEDEGDHPTASQRSSWPGRTMKYPRRYETRPPSQIKSPPLNSSTSSADGYESFENTNNKKKRKIPVSGALGQALASDVASMSIPTQSVDVSAVENEDGTFAHSAIGSGIGISGPGRGRYSRSTVRPLNERRPLSFSANAVNAFAGTPQGASTDKGIISTAIANAAETGQIPAPKGQENVSLLQRQKQAANPPQNFTFEYKSASSDKFASNRPNLPPPPLPKPPAALRTPVIPGVKHPQSNGIAPSQQLPRASASQQVPSTQANQKAPKPRRPGQALRMAALRRKEQQRYENYYNPPRPEDTWICEFCEYESIFGTEPVALVRMYEIKERRERKEREKNRKRLEQAKAKGRKGKKSKASQKHATNNPASGSASQNQRYDPRFDDPHDGDSQGEEYFDDEYEDSLPGPSPPEQEPVAYASHEYPPPPLIEPLEEHGPLKTVASAPT